MIDRSLIGKRSRRKGYSDEKRFEKWLQKEIDKYGLPYKILRTPRSGGIHQFESSDFLFKFLPENSWFKKIHIEKKDRKSWNPIKWIKEAEQKEIESGLNRSPVVIAKKPNQTDDYVIMKKELFAKLILTLEVLNK